MPRVTPGIHAALTAGGPGDRHDMELPPLQVLVDVADSVDLVALPRAVGEFLQLSLGGPGTQAVVTARLWAAAVLVFGIALAFGSWAALPGIDVALTPVGAVVAVACCIAGILGAASVHFRWRALFDTEDDTLLELVLGAEITPDASAMLTTRVKQCRLLFTFLTVFVWSVFGAVCYGLHLQDLLGADLVASIVVLYATTPFLFTSLVGALFLDMVVKVVTVDCVQLATKRVQSSTPATADFDSLLRDIVAMQHLVSVTATKLDKATTCLLIALSAIAAAMIFAGLGPQPADLDSWWHKFKISYFILAYGACVAIGTIMLLVQPAAITSACESLGNAINAMLVAKPAGDTLCMPTMEHQRHIQSLLGYARGMNQGQGMGYLVLRKRITHSFVMASTAKAVTTMSTFFPIILSVTRGEQGEYKLSANNTSCNTSCIC